MLTSRGWWLFLITFALLVVAAALGIGTAALAFLTLLVWFVGAWIQFQVRLRWTAKALYVERSLLRQGTAVEVLWAHSTATMAARLRSDSRLTLAYVAVYDRVPALARLEDGQPWNEGELHKGAPIEITYQIACPAAGRLRCDGLKAQFADLHGFFTATAFIRDRRSYRVLPPVTDEPDHLPTIKRHNLLPLLGTHRHLRPGSGSELLDLRDYLPGDPPKMIAWKASARRDRLMTKEFESEVPVRCTLFVDVSSSVRVGPPGASALTRVLAIASAVVHANAEQRDLTGLCLVDESAVRASIRPERGRRHVYRLIQQLADVADLAPVTEYAPLDRLVPLAYGVVQDIYPELLAHDVNAFPWWLPFWSPQPIYAIPSGARLPRSWPARLWFHFRRWLRESPIGLHRGRFFRLIPARHRMYRLRKKLAAVLAVRYRLGPAGLAWLLEDDVACSQYAQAFLAEHQVAAPLSLYDELGRYRFTAPAKIDRLGRALLSAVLRGKENELFVLLVDLLEMGPKLEPLLRAVRVALARHHQLQVICPWPPGVPLPGTTAVKPVTGPPKLQELLARASAQRLQQAFLRVQHTFAQLGVSVIAAPEEQAVSLILSRLHKLRGWQRSVR
ncbi:MAG: DUF58 domain-containing protein [Gemmataceae bacterium]|nr:DUF58 domain-containing protein [Gemmataceae bacterium]